MDQMKPGMPPYKRAASIDADVTGCVRSPQGSTKTSNSNHNRQKTDDSCRRRMPSSACLTTSLSGGEFARVLYGALPVMRNFISWWPCQGDDWVQSGRMRARRELSWNAATKEDLSKTTASLWVPSCAANTSVIDPFRARVAQFV